MGAPNTARRHSQQEAPPATRSLKPGWAHPTFLTNRSGRPTNLPVTNMEGHCPRGERPHSPSRTRAANHLLAFVGLPKITPDEDLRASSCPGGCSRAAWRKPQQGWVGKKGRDRAVGSCGRVGHHRVPAA